MSEPFERLLSVQDHDTHLDQLIHRRETLPERAELETVEARAVEVGATLAEARQRLAEVEKRQSDLEADVAASEQRIEQIDKRMYSGEVTASRDLQAMNDEITSLKRRISGLEDRVIEAMEEREPIAEEVEGLDAQAAELEGRRAALQEAIASACAEIDADVEAERAVRAEAASGLPDDLLTTYEGLRTRLGGIGAARLEHGTCMGCRLALPATEVDRLKNLAPGELAFCDQCGRILVP